MTKNTANPLEIQTSSDPLAAQNFQFFGRIFEQMSEAARIVYAAQVAYGQALMRANATLFGATLQQSGPPEAEIRPSVAARQSSGYAA